MFPDVPGESAGGLSSGAFLTCSADNTIRMWRLEEPALARGQPPDVPSHDLLNVIYVDGNSGALSDPGCAANASASADKPGGDAQAADIRTGIRTVCVSPDGKHLASGDRSGMLRVHDLSSMKEILKVEAHDAEILCLEYSKPETGLKLLATASRDRLIHVLDADDDYGLVQTLDEHSSSITAVRFAAHENKVKIISCGADKSIYFRTAHKTDRGTEFKRSHHTVRKTTLYDMAVDATCKYAAVGCQDRCIRIFNISSGKQKKLYKGSLSEDGSLLRVQIDPSGQFVATSCSNKNISIFDFYTGECVATMFGHSEIVTGMKFTNDCKHLISVSGDSCVFVWRLAPELTIAMRERLHQLRWDLDQAPRESPAVRREAYSAPALLGLSSDSDREQEEEEEEEEEEEDKDEDRVGNDPGDNISNTSPDSSPGEEDTGSDEEKATELRKHAAVAQVSPDTTKRPRRRWSRRMGSLEVMIKSMLDLRQLETSGHRRTLGSSGLQQQTAQADERPGRHRLWTSSAKCARETDGAAPFSEENADDEERRPASCSESPVVFDGVCLAAVPPLFADASGCTAQRRLRTESQDSRSPDSACSIGYDSTESGPDRVLDDADRRSAGSSGGERDRKPAVATSVDEALRTVTDGPEEEDFLRRNFKPPAEICSAAEQSRVPRLSMSSCFLAKGHNNRAQMTAKKEPDSKSTDPVPVSTVRPLPGSGESGKAEDRIPASAAKTESRASERDSPLHHRRARKKTAGPVQWRMSNPPHRASPVLDGAACLQKSRSAQNLAADPSRSPVTSTAHIGSPNRPQQLTLTNVSPRSSFSFSTSSSGSPRSPQSPPPWDSPKAKARHSYMSPTASSLAKSSRSSSSSLSDEPQPGSPPRRGSPPPVKLPAPPSRIPLRRHPLSPRRSLDLDVKPSVTCCDSALRASASAADVCREVPPPAPGSPSMKQKRRSGSESIKEEGRLDKERPLVPEENQTLDPQPDLSVTLETCRRTITDLHSSLRKTILLFTTLMKSEQPAREDRQQMRTVLSEALFLVRTELDSLPLGSSRGEGDKTLALLEQYAELLLKSVERRLDAKT
uniref:Mitogen-activated protein kinase-binding protein 1-like n=1 Tax=Kryptolebias marmoratus TaxID=37003 RepID=A0A3Q2ZRZ5_KRYMA